MVSEMNSKASNNTQVFSLIDHPIGWIQREMPSRRSSTCLHISACKLTSSSKNCGSKHSTWEVNQIDINNTIYIVFNFVSRNIGKYSFVQKVNYRIANLYSTSYLINDMGHGNLDLKPLKGSTFYRKDTCMQAMYIQTD